MKLSPAANPALLVTSHRRSGTDKPTCLSQKLPRRCRLYSKLNVCPTSIPNGICPCTRGGKVGSQPLSTRLDLRFTVRSSVCVVPAIQCRSYVGLPSLDGHLPAELSGKEARLAQITRAPAPSDLDLSLIEVSKLDNSRSSLSIIRSLRSSYFYALPCSPY